MGKNIKINIYDEKITMGTPFTELHVFVRFDIIF